MKETDLPSPRIGGKGHHLRRISALAISQLQASAKAYPNGQHPRAASLKAFFTAAANAVTPLVVTA